jgi:acetyltransferase-like isoleucine patch superfamily enzyme
MNIFSRIRLILSSLHDRCCLKDNYIFQPNSILPEFPDGFHCNSSCRIQGNPRIKVVPSAKIVLGDNVVLNSNPEGYHAGMSFPVTLIADRPDASIAIGTSSRLHGCCIHAWSNIKIGEKCLFAAGSQIIDAHGYVTDLEYARVRSQVSDDPDPIVIGSFCWIGLGALVMKGVTLGEGCTVGANSVVMAGEYPPFSLVVGSPAKIIRTLSEEQIYPEDYPLDQVKDGMGYMY